MTWRIVERRIGRAGGEKQRHARLRDWDARYGEGSWEAGYVIDGEFVPQEQALDGVYYASYVAHFEEHSEDLNELVETAKTLRNPHAMATTGVDLQVPAVMRYLRERGVALNGGEVVDIGTWDGKCSHPISVRLSPLHIRCALDPKLTLEKWWQSKKCLAVWEGTPS